MEEQQREFKTLEKCGREEIYRQIREGTMKSSTRDQAEGTFHEKIGQVKKVLGK